MTPSQLAFHEAHKARQARIKASAYRAPAPIVMALPEPSAAPEAMPEPAPLPNPIIPDISEDEVWFRMAGNLMTVRNIQEAVVRHYGISRIDLVSARRELRVVVPRQVAMYFCKLMTTKSLPEIGRRFGNRDHTTVMHAVRKIERELPFDAVLAQNVAEIEIVLNALEELQHETGRSNPSDQGGVESDEAQIGAPSEDSEGSCSPHAQAAS